jgi:hypothetical protein
MGQSASETSPVMSDGKVSAAEPILVASGTVNDRGPLSESTVTVVVAATGVTAGEADEAGADAGCATGDAAMPLLDVVLAGAELVVVVPPPPPPQALRVKDVQMATVTSDLEVFIFWRIFNKRTETK